MNWQILAESKIVGDIGWTLVHSLWQIGLVAGVLFILLLFFRANAVNLRNGMSVTALIISFSLPVITFVQLSGGMRSERFFTGNGARSASEKQAWDLNQDVLEV